ncbi:MAG: MoeA [Gemmatimonadetes bacterium]|nr:MoeA [Gemmatimonadota bacterium]
MVLCHDVVANGVRLRKGQQLERGDVPMLRAAEWTELHLIELENGDVTEDEAGPRLAAAAAGDGVVVREPSAGHWPLVATRRGILDVSVGALRDSNLLEGVCIYTLFAGRVVDSGERVAQAKIAPLVMPERTVGEVERIARGSSGFVSVRPFEHRRIGVVAAESLAAGAAARVGAALEEKVAWFGSTLLQPAFVPPNAGALVAGMRVLIDKGAELLLVAGSKPMDPLDPCWLALTQFGVSVERFGVPAHPGSLFWIAWHGTLPILGVPTCGLLTQASVVDLILPRILAGDRIGRAELAELGHGGLLTRESSFRFPPYRGADYARGEVNHV